MREIEGNPGKRAINKDEPKPGADPIMPDDLCEVAQAKWHQLVQKTWWGQWVTEADSDMLADYCKLFADKTMAEGKVREHGHLVASPNGFPCQSPWLQIVNRCRQDMRKIESECGGSPSARSRIVVKDLDEGKSKFSGLVAIKGGRTAS